MSFRVRLGSQIVDAVRNKRGNVDRVAAILEYVLMKGALSPLEHDLKDARETGNLFLFLRGKLQLHEDFYV